MAFRTAVDKREDHVRFIITGLFEISSVSGTLEEILKEVADLKASKVLLDVRELQGIPSLWERFQFATIFTALYLKNRARGTIPVSHYAVLGKEPLIDPSRFGEKVARNRGISVSVFDSEEGALLWLRDR